MSLQGFLCWCLVILTLLASCRKVDDPAPNAPPIAVAGSAQSVKTDSHVTLDGSASSDIDNDSLYFSWSFISKPGASTSVISGFDLQIAGFVPDLSGKYVVRLLISDGIENDSDTTEIDVTEGGSLPVANAGPDINADLGDKITLDGSASFDPNNGVLNYTWILLGKPSSSVTTLTLPNSVSPILTADKAGTYTVMLTVNNGESTASDTVQVITNPPVILGISPEGGTSGTEVLISGKNFDNTTAGNSVSFNKKAAVVLDASYTQLKVSAPDAAGSGEITLTTGGLTIVGPVFTYYAVVQSFAVPETPVMMARDKSGNLFVCGYLTHVIYKITPDGKVTTFAGTGQQGYQDGKAEIAQFSNPVGLVFDGSGNLFVADYGNNCIRMISTSGLVSTFAGTPQAGYLDGVGGQALFNNPAGLAIDGSGNLYVTEIGNQRVRKITPAAQVSTFAGSGVAGFGDGKGTAALFNIPIGITMDLNSNLIIADAGNNRIRKIDPQGNVTTEAGSGTAGFLDGAAGSAEFDLPYGVAVDNAGQIIIADLNNNRIRRLSDGVVSTFAGNGDNADVDGIAPDASFNNPSDVLFDESGGIYYVADFGNNKIRKIIPE